jgi:hypothetical protein
MAKMQAIDSVQVINNERAKKRLPHVGGVGGRVDLGEEMGKRD